MRRRVFAAALTTALASGALLSPSDVLADAWPQRPVRLAVGYPPGGPADIVARALAHEFTSSLRTPAVVESRAGAGGVVATDFVVNARDGHTFLFNSTGSHSVKPHVMKLRHDPWRDLKAITVVSVAPYVFVARASLGARTLPELAAYGKANPGKLTMGVAGNGTINHLVSGMFVSDAGIEAVTVPYAGATPGLQAMMAGQVDFMVVDPGAALPLIKDGRIVPLAVTDSVRLPFMPDVPTVGEAGYPGAEGVALWSLFAPASTPDDVIRKVRQAVLDAHKSPAFSQVLQARLMVPRTTTPEELLGLIRQEEVRYKKAIQQLNLKME